MTFMKDSLGVRLDAQAVSQLALSGGATFVALGDSIEHGSTTTDNGATFNSGTGLWTSNAGPPIGVLDPWAPGLAGGEGFTEYLAVKSGGRLRRLANAGVPGQTSAQMLARVPAILALRPKVVLLLAGTNDIGTSVPQATFEANMQSIVADLRAAGILVVMCTIPPRSSSGIPVGMTFAQYTTQLINFNTWLQRFANAQGLPIAPLYEALVDGPTGFYHSGYSPDGIHPYNAPAYRAMADAAWKVIQPRLPAACAYLSPYNADPVNLVNSGLSGSNINALWLNANGSNPDTPQGWTKVAATGVSQALVSPGHPDWPGHVLTLQAVAATTNAQVAATIPVAAGVINSGDIISFAHRVFANVEQDAGPGLNNMIFSSQLAFLDSGSNQLAAARPMSAFNANIDNGVAYIEARAPAGVASISLDFIAGVGTSSNAGTGRVGFSQPTVLNLTQIGAL